MDDAELDRQIMERVVAGDRPALTQLYDRHAPVMLGVATRVLGNRRDAEDLLHDVFLEAWQKAASFDNARGSVKTWLLLRVRSRAIDRLRVLAKARAHGMARDLPEPEPELASRSDDDDPARAADRLRARRAMEALSEDQRAVIELSYFEGLTCREIAGRVGVPVGTVKSRMSTAMGVLRRRLVASPQDRTRLGSTP